MNRWRRIAWIVILIADAGFLPWGAGAAVALDHLPGPRGVPILTAGYEGFTRLAWPDLTAQSPPTAAYIRMLFRLYGAYCFVFGLLTVAITVTAFRRGERWAWWTLLASNLLAFGAAMTYARMVHAIGPFEVTEYLGIAGVLAALAVTAPRRTTPPPVRSPS